MAKVFRLHEGQDGTGWFASKPITSEQLNTIKTKGRDVATSIPSPFARIDLVKSAFQKLSENTSDGIAGKKAQHKLVSDALDVAQLFYTYPKHKDKVRIVAWEPRRRFKEMIGDMNQNHSSFFETLQVFWEQDSSSNKTETLYNFEHVKRLYFIINRINNEVIGGTSPATLFFAAPDVKDATDGLTIICGHDKLFDDEYASLAEREPSFIQYFYALAQQPNFANYFPEVYSYLQKVKKSLNDSKLKKKVANLTADVLNTYPPCPVLDNNNNSCEVLQIPLGVEAVENKNIEEESDFVIRPDLEIMGQKPLVLPYHKHSQNWTYTTRGIIWDKNTDIPYKNENRRDNSILPVQGDKYYWLTIGNFLEETIIELPYTIDTAKFDNCGATKFLLPLTETFFKYFSASKVSRYLQLDELSGGGVEATLEIPVKNGKITFKKKYHQGSIKKLDVHLVILPFLRNKKVKYDYTIGVIDDRPEKNSEFQVKPLEKGKEIDPGSAAIRNPGTDDVKSFYYTFDGIFDVIEISLLSYKGFIVPKLKSSEESNEMHFAIDFGTTNTHIEFSNNQKPAKPFEVKNDYPLWQSLMNRNDKKTIETSVFEREITFEKEMIPYVLSDSKDFNFPLRTALTYNKTANFTTEFELFKQVNNYLMLEKKDVPKNLELTTELKWSNYNDAKDEVRVNSYIEYLLRLVFYKTLSNNGNIDKTKITWFYPVSMDEQEKNILKNTWAKKFKKVFNIDPKGNLNSIPESTAPYYYYKSRIAGLSLSIDIGGGSSDIAVFDEDDKMPKLISSFKFGANAIFGDGYPSMQHRNNTDRNGFVNLFYKEAKNAITENDERDGILKDIVEIRKDSADFSSFLFSLEKDRINSFSYTRLLQKDKSIKLAILFYYGAVAYYAATLIKKSGIDIPKYILLSGTGSKTASIIDSSGGLKNLSSLFNFFFNRIYGRSSSNLKIQLSEIPKEITCKGALKSNIKNNDTKVDYPVEFWIGGNTDDKWGQAVDIELNVSTTPKYKDIDRKAEDEIEASILDFYEILDKYVEDIRLEAKYLIDLSAYEKFKKIRKENIKDYLKRGIDSYYKTEDKYIEETLFFYPLIGILNKLAYELSKKEV